MVPEPVPLEALNPCKQWIAGQPVLLETQGHTHTAWLRLSGLDFTPRWICGHLPSATPDFIELTMSDPRETWSSAFCVQLAQALLCAESPGDTAHKWLAGPYSSDEPELTLLLEIARAELRRPVPTPVDPQPRIGGPEPTPRRAWTAREVQLMNSQHWIEAVDCTATRVD